MTRDELERLEARRCAAIDSRDGDTLRALLCDDYQHIHADGRLDDRDGFVARILGVPRTTRRGTLACALFPGFAILTGRQVNVIGDRTMTGMVQQLVLAQDGVLRFRTFQMTATEA